VELRDSALWEEIKAIALQGGGAPLIFGWRVEFKVKDKTYKPLKMISMEILRNYANAMGDEIVLDVMMGQGDFLYDIYPNRQNLVANLFCEQRAYDESVVKLSSDIETQTLRATLMDDHSAAVEANTSAAASREDLNRLDPITVRFQLIDQALEYSRLQSVQVLFRNTTVGDCLTYILTAASKDANLDENNKVLGVEMVDPANTDEYKHIVFPGGTKLSQLRNFLQKKVGGLYPTGTGLYLQKRTWFVFPLFDLTRFDKSFETLTVINIPPNQLPSIERSYRKTSNQTLIVATGQTKHIDRSESKIANAGNGVRYADARKVMENQPAAGDNKAVLKRSETNNEFITEERPSGLNNVVTSTRRITSNKFEELSQMSSRYGALVETLWENSDPGSIWPGMPLKFLYLKGNEVKELKGVVLGAHHFIQTYGQSVTDGRHICNTALQLFVEREDVGPVTPPRERKR
jgi:hypothetical protein